MPSLFFRNFKAVNFGTPAICTITLFKYNGTTLLTDMTSTSGETKGTSNKPSNTSDETNSAASDTQLALQRSSANSSVSSVPRRACHAANGDQLANRAAGIQPRFLSSQQVVEEKDQMRDSILIRDTLKFPSLAHSVEFETWREFQWRVNNAGVFTLCPFFFYCFHTSSCHLNTLNTISFFKKHLTLEENSSDIHFGEFPHFARKFTYC